MVGSSYQEVREVDDTEFSVLLNSNEGSSFASRAGHFVPLKSMCVWVWVQIATVTVFLGLLLFPFEDVNMHYVFSLRSSFQVLLFTMTLIVDCIIRKNMTFIRRKGYIKLSDKILKIARILDLTLTSATICVALLLAFDVLIDAPSMKKFHATYMDFRSPILHLFAYSSCAVAYVCSFRMLNLARTHNRVRPSPDALSYLVSEGMLSAGNSTSALEAVVAQQSEVINMLLIREENLTSRLRELGEGGGRGTESVLVSDMSYVEANGTELTLERNKALEQLTVARGDLAKTTARVQVLEAELSSREHEVRGLHEQLRKSRDLATQRGILLELEREAADVN